MRLTFNAGCQPHYADYLVPLYINLPEDLRGPFYARGAAATRARELGVPKTASGRVRERQSPVVVASHEDYRSVRPAPVVMVNHGYGATYKAQESDTFAHRHPSYSGGRDRDRIVLHLCPSERDADLNRTDKAKAVACGPWRLDPFLDGDVLTDPNSKLIVFTFHADVSIYPETQTAFPYYRQAIIDMASSWKGRIAAHSHPRSRLQMQPFWKEIGVPYIPHLDEVFARAGVLVCDNSSAQYESAALGIPNVVLNAPFYRRDVHHNARFWSHVPGIQVDQPQWLATAIHCALIDPPTLQQLRRDAVEYVYGSSMLDGKATHRAVSALVELAETWDS